MKKIIAVVLMAVFSVAPVTVYAADPVFTFAPPPVSYDAGKGSQRFTYVSADFGTDTLLGLGVTESDKEDSSQSIADVKESMLSTFFLTADAIEMVAMETGWKSEYHLNNSNVVFFHSFNAGFNFMNMDLGIQHSYSHTWVFPFIATGGIQTKIVLGDNTIITPYVYTLVNSSYSSNETYMGGLSSSTSSSDSFSSTGIVYGFDVFFSGMSMSAMISDSENDMIMFSLGFPTN